MWAQDDFNFMTIVLMDFKVVTIIKMMKRQIVCLPSSTQHLSSADYKNFPFCPKLRTRKTYGKQTLLSKPSTMAYLTMVVLPSWQLLAQYYPN